MDTATARRLAWRCQHGDCTVERLNLACPLYTFWQGKEGRLVIPTKRPDCKSITAESWLRCAEETI